MSMTEQEWLECTDPQKMLWLVRCKASGRKLRLFACACRRCIWHLLTDEPSRQEVEVAERFADGEATRAELDAARGAANAARGAAEHAPCVSDRDPVNAMWVAGEVADAAAEAAGDAAGDAAEAAAYAAEDAAWKAQCDLLRELFGNPFRPVSLAPSWMTPAVLTLAQAAYDNRLLPSGQLDNTSLAVLADALEEAGCDNADTLAHLRGPGPHVRGCWPVDLLLAKEWPRRRASSCSPSCRCPPSP
jgi:hypothetical protein